MEMKPHQLSEGVFQALTDQCETLPHMIPVGRGHSLLWVQQWCLENDGPVLTASASLQERTKAELSIQSTAMPQQPVFQNSLRKTAWGKREARERKGWLERFLESGY